MDCVIKTYRDIGFSIVTQPYSAPWEAAEPSKFDFTSQAASNVTGSPYITMLQYIPKKAQNLLFLIWNCWYITSSNCYYYQTFWTIIYHHSKQQ